MAVKCLFSEIEQPIHQTRGRKKPLTKEPVYLGLDTETYQGRAFLVCVAPEKSGDFPELVIDVFGLEAKGLQGISLFAEVWRQIFNLFNRSRNKHVIFTWNLNYDTAALLKLLPEDEVVKISLGYEVTVGRYRVRYLQNKALSVKDLRRDKKVTLYDACQLYNKKPLDSVSRERLGEHKKEDIDVTQFSNRVYIEENLELITEYCLKDAELCARLGGLILRLVRQETGVNCLTPYSQAYLAQEYLSTAGFYIPTINTIPEEVLKLAHGAMGGGRIEILQKGYFPEIYSADIKAAYPYAMTFIPDFSRGIWSSVRERETNTYGIYEVILTIPDTVKIPPFPVTCRDDKGLQILRYPVGTFKVVLWDFELDEVVRQGWNHYVIKGYEFTPTESEGLPLFPFKPVMEQLFKARNAADKEVQLVYKIMMNGVYGKLFQLTETEPFSGKYRAGKYYNPLAASRVTASLRYKMYRYVIDNGLEDAVIGFATDCVYATKPLPTAKKPYKMGDFTPEKKGGQGIIVANGVYAIADTKHLDKSSWKTRGAPRPLIDPIILLSEYDNEDYFVLEADKPCSLKEAIIGKDIDRVNIWESRPYTININGDRKRVWERAFKNVLDMRTSSITSTPYRL